MPFHYGHIARESVQVKEKTGKGRAGHLPCVPAKGCHRLLREWHACFPGRGFQPAPVLSVTRRFLLAGTSPWSWHRSGKAVKVFSLGIK
ncbi:MAG: hypothetical protein OXC57_04245 [Rhodobacteraceae bacterium]|nr:hypothetical protein [Paracoccaceae bacterium]